MRTSLNLIVFFHSIVFAFGQQNLPIAEIPVRMDNIKKATVQVIIDGEPSGTGFFINQSGLLVTNMHVVETENLRIDTATNKILSEIDIKINSGAIKEVKILEFFIKGQGYHIGKFYDFICLQIIDSTERTPFLNIGNFDSSVEGETIYTCGYPFGIAQPVYTQGIISTKFKQYSNDSSNFRDVAWLDLSMNKGNSGGAIMIAKANPKNDVVVGIASFNLNVLSIYAQQLKQIARDRGANAILGGLDIKSFAELTAVSIEANSYGIGGMISINHLRAIFK